MEVSRTMLCIIIVEKGVLQSAPNQTSTNSFNLLIIVLFLSCSDIHEQLLDRVENINLNNKRQTNLGTADVHFCVLASPCH